MKCKYCKRLCMHLTPVYYDGGGLAYKRIQCDLCPVRIEYYVNTDNSINDIFFMWEEPGKRYRIFCSLKGNSCLIQFQTYKKEWEVSEIELDFIPDWDPKTIKNKIKTYIVFS